MTEMRWRCNECNWIGGQAALLTAPNPFDQWQTVTGCPQCSAVDSFTNVCDEPGCKRDADCGWPAGDGYRRTCGKHMRERSEPEGRRRDSGSGAQP